MKRKLASRIDRILIFFAIFASIISLLSAAWLDFSPILGLLACWLIVVYLLSRRECRRFRLILFLTSFTFFCFIVILGRNPPISDFLNQYSAAIDFVNGNKSAYQTDYFNQWPAQFAWSIVEAFLIYIGGSNPLIIKIFECFCTSLMLVEVSMLVEHCFGSKIISQVVSCLLALFPTFYLMVGVMSNQVLSSLLCLTAILLFSKISICNTKCNITVLIAVSIGLLLALGNFIRSDGVVVFIALFCCLLIELLKHQKSERRKIFLKVALVVISYILTTCALAFFVDSSALLKHSNYPMATWKLAVGTNNDSSGSWSADLMKRSTSKIESGMTPSEAHLEIIQENTKDWRKNIETVVKKNRCLWWGDSTSFATLKIEKQYPVLKTYLLSFDRGYKLLLWLFFFASLLIMSRRKLRVVERLLILVFLGNFFVYQIIEVQPRYVYLCYVAMFAMIAPSLAWLRNFIKSRCN